MRKRYGSQRGFICVQWHRILYYFGYYNRYRRIQWSHVDRLVFVCKGNICRSAFAEIVANSKGLHSESCGINTRVGLPADMKAVEAAFRKGLDLSSHKTQSMSSISLRDRDLFIAMEPWHASLIERKYGNNVNCTLLGLWGAPASPYIHDPYDGLSSYFDRCFNQIEKSVGEITNEIRKAENNNH